MRMPSMKSSLPLFTASRSSSSTFWAFRFPLRTLAKDDNSANLVDTVMGLLAKDRKGNLKAQKVLELERLAVKSGNEDFMDGIRIIKDAYRPVPTCQFVEAIVRDENGKEHAIPLSMSAIE